MFKHKINQATSSKSVDIEDLVTLNEMVKKIDGKETTYRQIKRQKACSSMRAFADSHINDDDDYDHTDEKTLLEKGYEVEQIVGVTTMDNLGLLICYLIRYKGGQMELVPNKIVHQHCPQMVIEFLESRLVFQDQSDLLPISETVDEIDSDEEMPAETDEHAAQENQDEEDQTLYVFDELSKYLDLKDFENMIQPDDGCDDNDDDVQALDKSSQINKLTIQEDIPVIHSISDAPIDECEPRDFENIHFNYISSLFDRKTDEDGDEPLLIDHQAPVETELDADSDLQEINHTLSLSQHEQHSSHDTIEDRPGSCSAVDHWTDLSEIPESQLNDTTSSQQDVSLINESNQHSFEI